MDSEKHKRWFWAGACVLAVLLILTGIFAVAETWEADRNRLLKELQSVEMELERVEVELNDLRSKQKRGRILQNTTIEVRTIRPQDDLQYPPQSRYESPLPPAEEWNSGLSPLSRSR